MPWYSSITQTGVPWAEIAKPAFARTGAIGQGCFLQGDQLTEKGGRGGDGRKEEELFWRCDVCKEIASFERAVRPLLTFANPKQSLHSLKCLSTLEKLKTFAGSWQFLRR